MSNIGIALIVGLLAGLIDSFPLLLQRTKWRIALSVITQWMLLALVIPFIDWGLPHWMHGLILGELGMLPIMLLRGSMKKKRRLTFKELCKSISFNQLSFNQLWLQEILRAGVLGICVAVLADTFIGL